MKCSALLSVLALAAPLAAPVSASTPGTLRYGAVPAGASSKPVLLFIHGWNSDASTWSGSNQMESLATGAGYRTAFLDLYPDQSMWVNAPIIDGAVDQVRAHFPGAAVDLVCHSKGGVDAQTATVYYGTAAKVQRILTLSSPHHGTPIADLAWSDWAGWLAGLVGYRNDGDRVLQTGYMASFRAQTDALPASRAVPIYTAGGTKAGPLFSVYWMGGIAIGRTSDGVVPTDSSHLDYESGRLFTKDWNHDEVHEGSLAWPYLAANLAQAARFSAAAATGEGFSQEPALDHLYRGGATRGGTAGFEFPVDAGQGAVDLALETSKPPRYAIAIAPSGRSFHIPRFRDGQGMLPGAPTARLRIPAPEPGLWRIQFAAQGEDAYLFMASFPDDAERRLSLGEALEAVRSGAAPARLQAEARVATHRVEAPFSLVRAPGFREPAMLNHTLTLRWPDGRERSVILSVPGE